MRKVMVLQHVGHEPLGTLLPLLKGAGLRLRYINFGRSPDVVPDFESYNGLIVLGGPMGVYEADRYPHLLEEMRVIEQALRAQVPVLGICLGAQLLAHALGGEVRPASGWELGWYTLKTSAQAASDNLLRHFGPSENVFEMHQDTFTLPRTAVHLAGSELCPNQAFRFGANAYGLQFHLEADHAMILRWLNRPENREIMDRSAGRFSHEQLQLDTKANIERATGLSHAAFSSFVELFGLPERGELLGSTR